MRKFIFALIVFILAFAVPVTVYTLIAGPPEEFDPREEAAEREDVSSNAAIPQIISVPVTEVDVGDLYSYRVRALDEDGDTLEYEARLYPSWMSWDEDLRVLEGTPGEGDVGLHRVEIIVTDGKWVQTHAFDVSVTDEASESVVPVSDAFVVAQSSESVAEPSDSSSQTEAGESVQANETILPQDGDTGDPFDPEDYGLVPLDETGAQVSSGSGTSVSRPAVLGEATTLPNTASFNSIVGLSFGVAVLVMGIFVWSDARWDVSGRIVTYFRYQRGEQIGMDVRSGSKVKKRKIQL